MSNLWVDAAAYPWTDSGAHDEEQGWKRKIGEALDSSGMRYHTLPGHSTNAACPNDGTCLGEQSVPLEGGFRAHMHVRNGRMDPYLSHECHEDDDRPGELHVIPDTKETFGHPLNNLSVERTPASTLGDAMKSYTFSRGTFDAIRQHQQEHHSKPV